LHVKKEFGSATEFWALLEKLPQNRLRKCLSLLPKVLGEDDAVCVANY